MYKIIISTLSKVEIRTVDAVQFGILKQVLDLANKTWGWVKIS
jgi:hypothetical protein